MKDIYAEIERNTNGTYVVFNLVTGTIDCNGVDFEYAQMRYDELTNSYNALEELFG
jgi:hypothetical protein